MKFEFATAGRIVFGAGTVREIGSLVEGLYTAPTRHSSTGRSSTRSTGRSARRPLVVTGGTPERAAALLALLRQEQMDPVTYAVTGEPEVAAVRRGAALAKDERCDSVVGFGGGAALDMGKAIAALAANSGDVLDYLEIIGRGRRLERSPLPCVAIPTTAGTGAEVTRNSVITSTEYRIKVSLRDPMMLPAVALVDPELTYSLPVEPTASTGLDALTQLIEPFVCRRANPLTDSLCQEGIVRVVRSVRRVVSAAPRAAGDTRAPRSGEAAADVPPVDPPSVAAVLKGEISREIVAAREDMAVASLFGGLALANAGLGAVHGLAGPLGGMVTAPHGALCAALLPGVVGANLYALRRREPRSGALARYARVAELLTGERGIAADEAVGWLQRLVDDLGIPRLGSFGLETADIPELLAKATAASSMKGNPVELTSAELAVIVEGAL